MTSPVIPSLRYLGAKRAVTWLQDAFGFEAHLVIAGRGVLYTCKDFEGNVWSFGSYDPWH